jgi:uncharacterized membrane protein YdbT with pleckstrin-like domain
MDGESVLVNRRPGWTLWTKQIAVAALIAVFGLAGGLDTILGAMVLAGAILGYVVVSRSKSRYIVTDERVKAQIGLLSKTSMEYRIADIKSLSTSQALFERLLDYGTVSIRSGDNTQITWHAVTDHERVSNTIREQQRKYD